MGTIFFIGADKHIQTIFTITQDVIAATANNDAIFSFS